MLPHKFGGLLSSALPFALVLAGSLGRSCAHFEHHYPKLALEKMLRRRDLPRSKTATASLPLSTDALVHTLASASTEAECRESHKSALYVYLYVHQVRLPVEC